MVNITSVTLQSEVVTRQVTLNRLRGAKTRIQSFMDTLCGQRIEGDCRIAHSQPILSYGPIQARTVRRHDDRMGKLPP